MPGVSGELGYKALLLVSEVVTAWVLRAQAREQPAIPVRVVVSDERVRVEIADEADGNGAAAPDSGPAPRVDPYSRRILERLADRWGIENGGHASIWFELDRGRRAVTAFGSGPGRST
jgi:hypothetical protein